MRTSNPIGTSLGRAWVALAAWVAAWTIAAAGTGHAEGPAIGPGPAAGIQAGVIQADPRIGKVGAQVAGALDVSVAPESPFDVLLSDEQALQVEVGPLEVSSKAGGRGRDSRDPGATGDAERVSHVDERMTGE